MGNIFVSCFSLFVIVGSAMSIASSIGANVFPVTSGQLIDDFPMILMYLLAATIGLYSMTFLLAIFVGGKIKSEKQSTFTDT